MTHPLLRLLLCSAVVCGAHGIVTAAAQPPEPASKQIDPGLPGEVDEITILHREPQSASAADRHQNPILLKRETSPNSVVLRAIQANFARLFQSSEETAIQDPGISVQTVSQRESEDFRGPRGPHPDRDRDRVREQEMREVREHEEHEIREREMHEREERRRHRGEAGDDRPHPDRPHHPEDAHERVRALMEAAARLEHGGLREMAHELRQQAEQLERNLRPEGDHRDEVLRELMHNVQELRREVREVHERLDVVLKQMERSAPESDPAFRHQDEKRDRGPVRKFEYKKPERKRTEPVPGPNEKRSETPFVRPGDTSADET